MPRSWSREEVEATVADYLEMLDVELKGEPYKKAEHRRRLARMLDDRSESAIERKHQNISAVLIELGWPYIDGYKPLSNYQRLLFEVVEDRVLAGGEVIDLVWRRVEADTWPVPTVADVLSRLEAPPAGGDASPRDRAYEKMRPNTPRVVDYLAIEARNRALGRAGEEFVVNFERARLIRDGRSSLADRVEHVAMSRGDGLGFDVLSFNADGSERPIEVKTTAFGKETPFYVTGHEVRVSRDLEDRYHLYRPFRFRDDPRLFMVGGAFEAFCRLDPIGYRARLT